MSRRSIHYWKCDRPAAFHGTAERRAPSAGLEADLRAALQAHFGASGVKLEVARTQGNHLNWLADVDGTPMFVRVEDGPEGDDRLALESALLDRVRATGVPTPRVHGCDASRRRVPFAWQALKRIPHPDLNHWFKQGRLDTAQIAFAIGAAVATWQQLSAPGFGPFDSEAWHRDGALIAYHARYGDYFLLRLPEHLRFLVERGFLLEPQRSEIADAIARHCDLLHSTTGCLVHKDLALWNILGAPDHVVAFIDFDDAICGDPMDDLSLLACFHDTAFLQRAFAGYASVRPLPSEHRRRFWLHLLRNMIVKAVIRVGAGYFDRDDGFFLIGAGRSGADLKRFTEARLALALRGLEQDAELTDL